MEKTEAYWQILKAAKELFWKHGIKRVTVQEICEKAEVSKMTFYRQFKNKVEVAAAVLNKQVESNMQKYRAIMDKDIAFPKRIEQLIEMKYQQSKDVSQEFIQDLYLKGNSELMQLMAKHREQGIKVFMEDLANAQQKGWIRQDIKLEFILYLMNDMQQKMLDKNFTSMYDSVQDAASELTKYFFYGVSPAPKDEQ